MYTYSELYTLIRKDIEKVISFSSNKDSSVQTNIIDEGKNNAQSNIDLGQVLIGILTNIADLGNGISEIQTNIKNIVKKEIISGLDVTADSSPSMYVNVAIGKGTSDGRFWETTSVQRILIPNDGETYVWYINLYENICTAERDSPNSKLPLAKIVIPKPGTTSAIQDNKPDLEEGDYSYHGWIVSGKDLTFENDFVIDDESITQLRNITKTLLASNLVGEITISEGLTVTNSLGTINIDSQEMKIKNLNGITLSKFNKDGVFFYNTSGQELARFSSTEARVGDIRILPTSIQSSNYFTGSSGFKINRTGDVEFNDATFRGSLYADDGTIGGIQIVSNYIQSTNYVPNTSGFRINSDGNAYLENATVNGIINATTGNIGGFTIISNKMYGGTIQTGLNVGVGISGVVMDSAGIRGYSPILGKVFDIPSDGSAPSFSNGTINDTIFEISTNSVLRTSETVGDGSSDSAGVLINNTGLYACEDNQTLNNANVKLLTIGSAYFNGIIDARAGYIGGFTIQDDRLIGGFISGTTIIGSTIYSSGAGQRTIISDKGIKFVVSDIATGKYGSFKYGSGTKYGTGVLAYLNNPDLKIPIYIATEQAVADIHLYNRNSGIPTGAATPGDIAFFSGTLHVCEGAGTPGLWKRVQTI